MNLELIRTISLLIGFGCGIIGFALAGLYHLSALLAIILLLMIWRVGIIEIEKHKYIGDSNGGGL